MKENTENGFYKRRNGECSRICEMQKGYGVKNIFRKFKWYIILQFLNLVKDY